MPRDLEARERRREVILEILREGKPVSNQIELAKLLKERGFEATQSSVSRDLRDLGVVRVKGRYVLTTWTAVDEVQFQIAISFIREMNPAGPHLLVVSTLPGTAQIVASAIDGTGWDDVVGTVAGDATLFIATATVRGQKRVLQQLSLALKELDEGAAKLEAQEKKA
ncbi:MAG TPA: arginine repressor [Thermoanaerobaculia bacterium]|nr:arginine repressor [Thermoanaerobaculia bacterium]